MFGAYRYILALLVMTGHHLQLQGSSSLVELSIGGKSIAVFGFYLVSGYLMTKTLQENYPYSRRGIGRFLRNRFLRIFPGYWAALVLSILVMASYRDPATLSRYDLYWPNGAGVWLRNILVLWPYPPASWLLVPPSWSLKVEIFYYLLFALGISRTRKSTWIWVGASTAILCFLLARGASFEQRYFTVWGASLPFSLGAIFFHFRDARVFRKADEYVALSAMALLLLDIGLGHRFEPGFRGTWAFYFALFLNFVALIGFSQLERGSSSRLGRILVRWDQKLGDLTYPIFLLHWVAAILVSHFLTSDRLPLSLGLFVLCFIVTHLLSYLFVRLLDRPLFRIRLTRHSESVIAARGVE